MKRRCFVVSGQSWARVFVLVDQDDLGCPIWTRLEVVSDGARRSTSRGKRPIEAAGDDGRRFAGNVIRAAGAAMRSYGAEELVLVAPPLILGDLDAYRSMLARHGIETTAVAMSLDLLVRHIRRVLMDGAVTRTFSFASASPALTRAA
jgi:hypothetical protein